MDSDASVAVLAGLDDPDVLVRFVLLKLVVGLFKSYVLGVILGLDVESQRNRHFERVKVERLVVVAYVHKQSFLVGQVVVVLKLAVGKAHVLVEVLEVVGEFGLPPLGPNQMGALHGSLAHSWDVFVFGLVAVVVVAALADEAFAPVAAPPAPPLDDLPHSRVVVAAPHEEPEEAGSLLGLGLPVGLIEVPVQLLHQLHIYCIKEVRLLDLNPVQEQAVAFGHWDVEELKQLDHRLVVWLDFLFK